MTVVAMEGTCCHLWDDFEGRVEESKSTTVSPVDSNAVVLVLSDEFVGRYRVGG